MSHRVRVSKEQLDKMFEILVKKPSGKWKNKSKAAAAIGVSRPTLDQILKEYPEKPIKPRLVTPQFEKDYESTACHKKIVAVYMDKATGKLTSHGSLVDRFGLDLYLMAKQHDPLTMPLDFFMQAKDNPAFADPDTGDIKFGELSRLRIIMGYAGFNPRQMPELTTKGKKVEPHKKTWYLEETELIKFIYAIEQIDTLVYCRLAFEGGGRFSSTSMITTDKISFDQNLIIMQEPKVGQVEERYFVPKTFDFLRRYIRDYNIVGRLFRRSPTMKGNYIAYSKDLLTAGLRAGLWQPTGTMRKEVRGVHGAQRRLALVRLHEGKKTSTHLLKHTFVSLASLHGFGLDDVSEQTGTDPDTLRKYYLGVGKKKLKGVILGQVDYVPWQKWISDTLDSHWNKAYDILRQPKTGAASSP